MSTVPRPSFLAPFKGLDAEVFELAAERVAEGLYGQRSKCCCCPAIEMICWGHVERQNTGQYLDALASVFCPFPSSELRHSKTWWDNGSDFLHPNLPFDSESRIFALLLAAEFTREVNSQE
jgi:hypothetical protein